MKQILLSAFSDEYASDFEEQLRGMQHFSINHIELRHVDGKNVSELTQEEVREAGKKLSAYGVRVSAIGSPLGKIRLDGDLDAHMETAKRIFDTANQLGTKYVRMFSFYPPKGENILEKKSEVLGALERMLLLAEAQGIILCHENEAGIYGATPLHCRELLDHFGGALRCVFDMGNFVLEGVTPFPDAYTLLSPYIAYFHIKDALAAGAIVPPGKGDASIREILNAHREAAAEDFFISLEPHLETFSGLNALIGRAFENPYKYADAKEAFADAVIKLRELI